MVERKITRTRKGYDGGILALCNLGKSFLLRIKNDAIRDIENILNNYFVEVNGKHININAAIKRGSKHLISDKQKSSINILNELLKC